MRAVQLCAARLSAAALADWHAARQLLWASPEGPVGGGAGRPRAPLRPGPAPTRGAPAGRLRRHRRLRAEAGPGVAWGEGMLPPS